MNESSNINIHVKCLEHDRSFFLITPMKFYNLCVYIYIYVQVLCVYLYALYIKVVIPPHPHLQEPLFIPVGVVVISPPVRTPGIESDKRLFIGVSFVLFLIFSFFKKFTRY